MFFDGTDAVHRALKNVAAAFDTAGSNTQSSVGWP